MAPFLVSETLRVLWTKAAVTRPLGVAAGVTLWLPAKARGCPPPLAQVSRGSSAALITLNAASGPLKKASPPSV